MGESERTALGIGIGLLISERLNKDQRRSAGWALLAIGAFTTIPLVLNVVVSGLPVEGRFLWRRKPGGNAALRRITRISPSNR
jgi:hypothetical protein